MIDTLKKLTRLLSTDPLTVEDVVSQVGTLVEDPGGAAAVKVRPTQELFREAQVFRHPATGAPDVLRLVPADGQALTAKALRAAFGDFKRLPSTQLEADPELFRVVDYPELPYQCAVIAEVSRSDESAVTVVSLRRDIRLP